MVVNDSGVHAADVVVVGGGGAALVAACRARELGAEVVLVSKKRPALASCTAYAGGGFTAPVCGLSRPEYGEMVRDTGRDLGDPALIGVLKQHAASSLKKLAEWGVDVRLRRGGASVTPAVDNPLLGGTGLTYPLLATARELGVEVVYPFTVTRLLGEEFGGRVCGVSGVDGDNRWLRIYSNSVVLATGGAGRLYRRTDNPSGITGDGYALALAAGASLRDMEFVQFYPLGSAHLHRSNWFIGAHLLDDLRLTDGRGEEFLPELMHSWGVASAREINLLARDRLSVEIQRRCQETGEVILHLEDAGQKLRRDRAVVHLARLLSGDRRRPFQPVQVRPIQHFMSGGVVIDEWGQTEVDGLYACGEVTGGVHGANRVGGNALTELVTFGLRAAQKAAESAKNGKFRGEIKDGYRIFRFFLPQPQSGELGPPGDDRQPGEFTARSLRNLMSSRVGPVRRGDALQWTLQSFDRWAREDNTQTRRVKPAASVVAAAAVAASAAARCESRGCHWREDFPDERPERYVLKVTPELMDSSADELDVALKIRREPVSDA